MRVLLDESVPVQVRDALYDHSVSTAVEMGWRGISNGELLDRAEAQGFELVIVADKNLRHQQNLRKWRIAILELWTNHQPTLERHFARIRERVQSAWRGQCIVLEEASLWQPCTNNSSRLARFVGMQSSALAFARQRDKKNQQKETKRTKDFPSPIDNLCFKFASIRVFSGPAPDA